VSGADEVVFIDNNDERARAERGDGGFVFFVERCGGVEYKENHVCFGHGFTGFRDAQGFGFVAGFAEACCINKFYGNAFNGDAFGDEIAGGAGGCGDDGSIAFHQAIEKGGLTDVWAAYDGQSEAVVDYAPVGESLLESLEGSLNGLDLGGDFARGDEVYVVFGEVDAGFQSGNEGYKLLFYWGYLAGEGAAQLLRGDTGLVEGGGFDEVVNCFCLCEIQAAGEEGSLGKFSGFGEASAGGEALADEVVEENGGAVGGDFHDVFRRVGVGFFEVGDYGFV
jgi:hypothetical protein